MTFLVDNRLPSALARFLTKQDTKRLHPLSGLTTTKRSRKSRLANCSSTLLAFGSGFSERLLIPLCHRRSVVEMLMALRGMNLLAAGTGVTATVIGLYLPEPANLTFLRINHNIHI